MRELAEHLKSERMKRGLTLGEISGKVRISPHMLEIIERGDYERIGAAILVRSFIQSYCEALDMDPAPLLEQYAAEIAACDRQKESIKRYRDWSRDINKKRRLSFWGVLILCGSLIAALYGGMWVYERKVRMTEIADSKMAFPQMEFPPDLPKEAISRVQLGKMVMRGEGHPAEAPDEHAVPTSSGAPDFEKRSLPAATSATTGSVSSDVEESQELDARNPPEKPQETATVLTAQERSNSSLVLADDTVHDASQSKPEKPLSHSFRVEAEQKTWIQVKLDNDKTYSAMMQPGDKREWETKDGMHVVVGNAGGVRMEWDGNPIASDGKPGQVLRFRLPDFQIAERHKPR